MTYNLAGIIKIVATFIKSFLKTQKMLRWVKGKKNFPFKKTFDLSFHKTKRQLFKNTRENEKTFFQIFMLSQQKNQKIVHFFEHQYFMNQCMFFADFLMNYYPLDTQRPKPKLFGNSYIFHNGRHLDLLKKKWVKCIVCFLKKTRTNYFLSIILVQALLQVLKNIA